MGATGAMPESAADRRETEPKPIGEVKPARERNTTSTRRAEDSGTRRAARRQRVPKENEAVGRVRYFLTKAASNGSPELDEELPDEHQALLAAHKADRSFVTVEEWNAKADRRKGITVLGKEPVVRH